MLKICNNASNKILENVSKFEMNKHKILKKHVLRTITTAIKHILNNVTNAKMDRTPNPNL